MHTHSGWKSAEVALVAGILLLATILVLKRYPVAHIAAAVAPPAFASAALSHARGKARSAAALAEAIAHRLLGPPPIAADLIPYKSGQRKSAATGETIHVYEYKQAPTPSRETAPFIAAGRDIGDSKMKDQIVTFLTGALLKELHKLMPDIPADADAQVSMMVSGGVGLLWDIAKLEGAKELQKLGAGELSKLFPQLAPAAA